MHYTSSAITQLKRWYKKVLIKCTLLNTSVLAGVIFANPVNAKTDNWITIDGKMFDSDGYYSGTAQGDTLKLNYFTSQGAYYTISIPHWNDIYFSETTVTLTGGTFSVDFDSVNRNGPLWAKGGTLEVLGHTLTLEQTGGVPPSYIASEVAFRLKNNATLVVNSSSSVVINSNDSIKDGKIIGYNGTITFTDGTHTLGNDSWIFGTPLIADPQFSITGGTVNMVDGTRVTANANDDISGGTLNATGGVLYIEGDQTLQHNSSIANEVILTVSSGTTLTIAGNAVVNINEDNDPIIGSDDIDTGIMNIAGGTLSINNGSHQINNNSTISAGKLAVTGGNVDIWDMTLTGGVLDVTGGVVWITANNKDSEFTRDGIGIQTASGATLNIRSYNRNKVILNNEMSLAGTTNINGGEIVFGTTQAITSLTSAANLNINGGTLSFINNQLDNVSFTNAINDTTSFNLALDIKADSEEADQITANLAIDNPVYLSELNFINDNVASGSVQIADGGLMGALILDENADTGIYTTVSYDNTTGYLSFADPVSWAKRTNGVNSIYKWTKTNTSIMPVDNNGVNFYVNILKKSYTDGTAVNHSFKYTWNDTTKRLDVANADDTALISTTGDWWGDGTPSAPYGYDGDYIGNAAEGSIVISGLGIKADTITGDFVGNTSARGGAIKNDQASINSIVGGFIGNSASNRGGAIYNGQTSSADNAKIGSIVGDFIGNYAIYGGAIFNDYYNDSQGKARSLINEISGDFIGNTSGTAGGAFYNVGIINSIKGNFIGNTTLGEKGGAIYNHANGTITVEGQFVSNTAINYGGAIYSEGTANIIDSSFIGNISSRGAAIYANGGKVNITAQNKDVEFTNNNQTGASDGSGYGIYNNGAQLSFNASSGKAITINDKVFSNGILNINSDENYNIGTVAFNNRVNQTGTTNINGGSLQISTNAGTSSLGNVTFSNEATLDLANGEAQELNVTSLTGDGNLKIDFTETSNDSIKATSSASEGGTLIITALSGLTKNNEVEAKTILKDAANINLDVSSDLRALYDNVSISTSGYTTDTIKSDANWTDSFKDRYWQTQTGTQLVVDNTTDVNAKTLAYKFVNSQTIYDPTKDVSLGDTLALVNTKNDATRSFVTDDATAIYDVTADLGTTATGVMTVSGTTDGTNTSTIDLKGFNGFTVVNGATLNIDTVNIVGTQEADGSFINNTAGTVSLNNVDIAANESDIITNTSTMNLSGKNNIAAGISGSGTTNITSGETTITADIAQNQIAISNGATLTASADNINADISNNGTYNVTGGTIGKNVTGGSLNIIGDVTVGSGISLATTSSTIANGVSLDVGTNSVNLGNAVVNGILKLKITNITANSSSYTGGQINANSLTLGNSSALLLTIAPNLLEKNASTGPLDLINVDGETTGNFANLFLNNRYKATIDENGKFIIANYIPVEDVIKEAGGSDNNVATGIAWDEAILPAGTPAAEMQEVLNDLSQHDAHGYVEALTNLAPTDSMAIVGITQDFNNLIGEQLASRLGVQGMNPGDVFENQNTWVQIFYNHSKQDSSNTHRGFTGKTSGLALGADGEINNNTTLGLGYAYGHSKIDSAGRDIDVNGHTIFSYGKYQPSAWYLRGMVNYGFARYDEKANVAGFINDAEYNVYNYGMSAYVGYDLPNGFTPEAGLRFTRIDRDSYTDRVGQHIKSDHIDVLMASTGLNYAITVKTNDLLWSPKAHFALTYDLLSDNKNTTVGIGESSYNIRAKRLNRLGAETGIGAEISVGKWGFSAGYELGIRDDYLSQTGILIAKYNF